MSNEGRIEKNVPLCGQKRGQLYAAKKRGRFASMQSKKRAIFLYLDKNEGDFDKRGPLPRAFLDEGQKRGLNVKYPPKTRAI